MFDKIVKYSIMIVSICGFDRGPDSVYWREYGILYKRFYERQ
jgi:hypothetical protein